MCLKERERKITYIAKYLTPTYSRPKCKKKKKKNHNDSAKESVKIGEFK